MSGRLVEIDRISEFYESMGDWSKSIVNHYWPAQAPSSQEKPTICCEARLGRRIALPKGYGTKSGHNSPSGGFGAISKLLIFLVSAVGIEPTT
jgi:hypothetical protein